MSTNDNHLHTINNGNEKDFFDSIFGYLLRRQPCILKDPDGKSRLILYYEKWQQEYIDNKSSKTKCAVTNKRSGDIKTNTDPVPLERQNSKNSYRTPGGDSNSTSTISISNKDDRDRREKYSSTLFHNSTTTSSKTVKRSHSPLRNTEQWSHNGAVFENYLWNQSFEDLEVRVPVGAHISKGNQVKVSIERCRLIVEVQLSAKYDDDPTTNLFILNGEFPHPVKMDQSSWSLSPKDHISINLEKVTPMWWDRLITSEPGIDLKNLALERDYNSLPDDEKAKISRIIFEKEQQAGGVKITDKSRATEILKEAWDKDGSPFKGQPFDPSVVQMDHSMN